MVDENGVVLAFTLVKRKGAKMARWRLFGKPPEARETNNLFHSFPSPFSFFLRFSHASSPYL